MDNTFIMAVVVIVIIYCIFRVPSDAEVAKEHILSRALKSLVHAFVSPGNPAGRDKKTQEQGALLTPKETQEQKSPLTTEDLANSMIMEVSVNDPFFLECKKASDTRFNPQYGIMCEHGYKQDAHSTFKKWLENHPGWIFNLSCLAIILSESFSMKIAFDDYLRESDKVPDSLTRLLFSINNGKPNCLKCGTSALSMYLYDLIAHGKELDEDICRVLIQDPRFDEVRNFVDKYLERWHCSVPLMQWQRFKFKYKLHAGK